MRTSKELLNMPYFVLENRYAQKLQILGVSLLVLVLMMMKVMAVSNVPFLLSCIFFSSGLMLAGNIHDGLIQFFCRNETLAPKFLQDSQTRADIRRNSFWIGFGMGALEVIAAFIFAPLFSSPIPAVFVLVATVAAAGTIAGYFCIQSFERRMMSHLNTSYAADFQMEPLSTPSLEDGHASSMTTVPANKLTLNSVGGGVVSHMPFFNPQQGGFTLQERLKDNNSTVVSIPTTVVSRS